jgi:hypothetical protein
MHKNQLILPAIQVQIGLVHSFYTETYSGSASNNVGIVGITTLWIVRVMFIPLQQNKHPDNTSLEEKALMAI